MVDVLTAELETDNLDDEWTPDALEQRLIGVESEIARLRHEQLGLLHRADVGQVAANDGSRSLQEWTAARLDITPQLAGDLVTAARALTPALNDSLAAGEISFDRAVATSRLAASGAAESIVDASYGHDLVGVGRLTAAHRRMGPDDEQEVFDSRHAAVQLSLDQTSSSVWATLTGVDSQIVTEALDMWADRLPMLPDGTRDTRAHRQADAFVAIFRHALTTDGQEGSSPSGHSSGQQFSSGKGPHVLLTADFATLAESGGTKGVAVVGGPRVGINALEEALCNGSVSLDVNLDDGRVLGLGHATDVIPPRERQHVLARDGGCTADGCQNRYHLEVHHIVPRSRGGGHDLDNLTTLCWYHHHVVVHGMGYTIDPDTSPYRRRFRPPGNGPP